MSRAIGIFVYSGHQILDLAGPLAAFQIANRFSETPVYQQTVVSLAGGLIEGGAGLSVNTQPLGDNAFDTFIVAGGGEPSIVNTAGLIAVKDAAGRARRVASVCTGAFVLAAAGLLNGRRATTHWRHAAELRQAYPTVQVASDAIFVRDGRFWSSAGISAGIDLALALIKDDCGPALAQNVSRELVVYYRRPGGQSQFSTLVDLAPESDRIGRVLGHIRAHLDEPLMVERLADIACLSPRQFARVFRRETGETPARAIERLRVEAARPQIESQNEAIEKIAPLVGFSDPERMRRAFIRWYGLSPQALRRLARCTD